jgi:hypothetical protein
MASFFKKIFGKVEQVGEQAANQAKTQAQNASATASNAGAAAQSHVGGARDIASSTASQARDQASATATGAQNQATSALGQARDQATAAASNAQGQAAAATGGAAALFSSVEALFSGGMPNVTEIENVIDNLPKGELSTILANALHQVPADSRNQIGQLVNQQSPAGAPPSSGVASGNPADLGDALAGILKAGGVSELAGLFTGGTGAATGTGGLVNEVMGETTGQANFNFGALLKNPLAQQLLGAILPALMKAGGQPR